MADFTTFFEAAMQRWVDFEMAYYEEGLKRYLETTNKPIEYSTLKTMKVTRYPREMTVRQTEGK
jgi:hypothetical protein